MRAVWKCVCAQVGARWHLNGDDGVESKVGEMGVRANVRPDSQKLVKTVEQANLFVDLGWLVALLCMQSEPTPSAGASRLPEIHPFTTLWY